MNILTLSTQLSSRSPISSTPTLFRFRYIRIRAVSTLKLNALLYQGAIALHTDFPSLYVYEPSPKDGDWRSSDD